jgi:hypothetical protein
MKEFYCLLPCNGSISYGQNIKEVIQDINKAPLEMANVMAVNQTPKLDECAYYYR